MVSVAIRPARHTLPGILTTPEFPVSFPSVSEAGFLTVTPPAKSRRATDMLPLVVPPHAPTERILSSVAARGTLAGNPNDRKRYWHVKAALSLCPTSSALAWSWRVSEST